MAIKQSTTLPDGDSFLPLHQKIPPLKNEQKYLWPTLSTQRVELPYPIQRSQDLEWICEVHLLEDSEEQFLALKKICETSSNLGGKSIHLALNAAGFKCWQRHPGELEKLGRLSVWGVQAQAAEQVILDGRIYCEAMADEQQELSYWAYDLKEIQKSKSKTSDPLILKVALTNHLFLSVAKLRALRLLCRELLGEGKVFLHAVSAERIYSTIDEENNFLRATLCAWAAFMGEADGLTLWPSTHLRGASLQEYSEVQKIFHVLNEEAHLGAEKDAFLGSYFMDELTLRFYNQALLEARCMQASELETSWQKYRQKIAHREILLTGVNAYAPSEAKVYVANSPLKKLFQSWNIPTHRLSEDFEALHQFPKKKRAQIKKVGQMHEYFESALQWENFFRLGGLEIVEEGGDIVVLAGPSELGGMVCDPHQDVVSYFQGQKL